MPPAGKSALSALVVGTGHGCRVHLPALRAAGFDVVGLVGADAERTRRRAERSGVSFGFADLDEAIERTGASVVTIATPPLTHAPLVHAALARGRHVLCEKPFAKDADEARQLLELAERAGVIHLLGNQFRLAPERRIIARAIQQGRIGEPRFVSLISYNGLVAHPEARMPRWWFDKSQGGGWLGASGSHTIDMVRTWLGEFASVSAQLQVVADREGVADDSFTLQFELAGGVTGVMQQSGGAWGPSAEMTRIAGSRGTLWQEGQAVRCADHDDGVRDLAPEADWVLEPFPPSEEPGKQFLHLEIPPSVRLFKLLRSAIEGDRTKLAGLATFADGLAAMKVLDAARESAARGGARVLLQ